MPSHSFKKGDVVLVPFPFADLKSRKVRPALVVSGKIYHNNEPDLIIAAITGNLLANTGPTDYLISDWQKVGLFRPSVVKVSLATIEPSLVRYTIGQISPQDLQEFVERLKLALEL